MAVLMTLEVPGGTTAKYDRTNEILGIHDEHDVPAGLISHVCGETDDGIVVVDVWDSVVSLDDFANHRLGAALEKAEMPPAEPHTSPVHNLFFGRGAEANVIVLIETPGMSTDTYDAIAAKMPSHADGGANHPAVMHVAAAEPDGHVRVVDLWGSEEAFRELVDKEIGPAMGGPEPFVVRFVPVYNRIQVTARATA
jgi:hypothetical protein